VDLFNSALVLKYCYHLHPLYQIQVPTASYTFQENYCHPNLNQSLYKSPNSVLFWVQMHINYFFKNYSGLDSCTSRQCLAVLKLLAREGRTVVCTIHQPSASLFEMFDHLYVITGGMCIYQGSIKGMVPYLSEAGLDCPPYHNPADFGMNYRHFDLLLFYVATLCSQL
jgi:hypothetical protein